MALFEDLEMLNLNLIIAYYLQVLNYNHVTGKYKYYVSIKSQNLERLAGGVALW
jgi:hypothetical protein